MQNTPDVIKKNTSIIFLLFLASAIPLAAAYTSEYGFGLKPCELCILQRIPFCLILGFSTLFLVIKPLQKFTCYLLLLCIIAFFADAGIAFFHMGVEFKWWTHGACTAALKTDSFEAFKNSIMTAANVRCDEPQFKFLNVSMAGWNFVLNILYVIAFSIILKKKVSYAKNQ